MNQCDLGTWALVTDGFSGALHVPLELRKDSSSPTQEWVVCSQITSIRSTRGACPVLSKRLPCSLQSASHVLLSGALARSGRWGEERLTQSSHLRGSVRMPQIPAQSRTAGNPFSWGLTYKYSWSWGYCLIMIIFFGGCAVVGRENLLHTYQVAELGYAFRLWQAVLFVNPSLLFIPNIFESLLYYFKNVL